MPIYEYQCQHCERVSEFFLRISDPSPESCPKCAHTGPMKKQISQTSFSLKGEGWYVTDYKPQTKEPAQAETAALPAKSTDEPVQTPSGVVSETSKNPPNGGAAASPGALGTQAPASASAPIAPAAKENAKEGSKPS